MEVTRFSGLGARRLSHAPLRTLHRCFSRYRDPRQLELDHVEYVCGKLDARLGMLSRIACSLARSDSNCSRVAYGRPTLRMMSWNAGSWRSRSRKGALMIMKKLDRSSNASSRSFRAVSISPIL